MVNKKQSTQTANGMETAIAKVKMGYGMSAVKRLGNNKKKKKSKREPVNVMAFADEQYGENEMSDTNAVDGQSVEEPNTDSTSDQASINVQYTLLQDN